MKLDTSKYMYMVLGCKVNGVSTGDGDLIRVKKSDAEEIISETDLQLERGEPIQDLLDVPIEYVDNGESGSLGCPRASLTHWYMLNVVPENIQEYIERRFPGLLT